MIDKKIMQFIEDNWLDKKTAMAMWNKMEEIGYVKINENKIKKVIKDCLGVHIYISRDNPNSLPLHIDTFTKAIANKLKR